LTGTTDTSIPDISITKTISVSNMAHGAKVQQRGIYNKLRFLLNHFRDTCDTHLAKASLSSLDVDISSFDLEDKVNDGGVFFLPMRLDSYLRTPVCARLGMEFIGSPEECSIYDARNLCQTMYERVAVMIDPDTFLYQTSQWQQRRQVDPASVRVIVEADCRGSQANQLV
jgi:hypothetical protein